jgi:hypothetical protein
MEAEIAEEPWANLLRLMELQDPAPYHRVYPMEQFGGADGGASEGNSSVRLARHTWLTALADPGVAASLEHHQRAEKIRTRFEALSQQLRAFESISRCPILAITGLLNSGKSSLLATYLSPKNRKRVLRGLGNQAGTHRFVLWLPKIWWQDSSLLTVLVSYLSSLFGHPPEHLSDDPKLAALQYNGEIRQDSIVKAPLPDESSSKVSQIPWSHSDGRPPTKSSRLEEVAEATQSVEPLTVPLIAYDEALDELKLGIVDCPDIQTGFVNLSPSSTRGGELAEQRKNHLGKIGRLCSAFVVVSKLGSLHDDGLLDILGTLRDSMPGVPRILAVNKVKSRYSPDTVAGQARGLVERFGIESVFAAYDYRSSKAGSRIPPLPSGYQNAADEPLPLFFDTQTGGESSRSDYDGLRYLFHLGKQLDAGTLSRESNRSLRLQLKASTLEMIEWHTQNVKLQEIRLRDAWKTLSSACFEFMAERDESGRPVGLRLQTSPAIVSQMAASLQRTAPSWMRLSLKIDRTARQLHNAVANSAARFKILQSASTSVQEFARRFRRGQDAQVVTPEKLAKTLRSLDIHEVFEHVSDERLLDSVESGMQRFAEEDATKLNSDQLDEWSKSVWKNMSLREKLWKGTQPLAVMMAPLLAAVLVPIDAGGTAVLVFASTKELLAAAGIAAVMTPMATGSNAIGIVQRETPWRQMSDLFAVLCDSVGVPRPVASECPEALCNGVPRRLLASDLPANPPSGSAAIEQWKFSDTEIQELRIVAEQLGN